MADRPISDLTLAPDALEKIYRHAVGAFGEWRSSFAAHRAEESRYAEALATHRQDPEKRMPEEYEGIESLGDLAQMNASKRGYLEGRFEGICQVLSTVAGGDPMDWNIRIQNETTAR